MRPLIVGLVLAAGAGRRFGRAKATVQDSHGGASWAGRAASALLGGGCSSVLVVLGAEADLARSLLGDLDGVRTVIAHGWADGLSASLRAGLIHLEDDLDTDRAVITLVDLPDVGSAVVERVLAAATDEHALVRATYGGVPGHPVVLGRRHWRAVSDSLSGDRGAGRYLDLHDCVGVECSDLATGRDVDEPRQT